MLSSFQKMPAFYVGVAMALGCGALQHWTLAVVAVVFLVIAPRRWLLVAVMVLIGAYALWRAPKEAPTCSEGVFYPQSAKGVQLPFKSGVLVKGTFEGYPCTLLLARNAKLHLDGAYRVQGQLKGTYFRPKKQAKWIKVPGTFSFAGMRYRCKLRMQAYLQRYYGPRETADFITALSIGEMENRLVRFFFSRVGLQHILAISGFHFALIALMVGSVLRLALPIKWATAVLLVLLAAYAFLLGDTPSVMRSFLMIGLYLLGLLIDREPVPLNIFGAALMLELLYCPEHIKLLGFVLSYSATLGIFLLYEHTNGWVGRILRPRPERELKLFSRWDSYGYLTMLYLKKAFALNLAVYLPLLPILLTCFGTFPCLNLLYNLLIPPLIVGVIGLLLIGLFIPWIHYLNSLYATWVLQLIRYPPHGWDATLHLQLPLWIAVALTGSILLWGLKQKQLAR